MDIKTSDFEDIQPNAAKFHFQYKKSHDKSSMTRE